MMPVMRIVSFRRLKETPMPPNDPSRSSLTASTLSAGMSTECGSSSLIRFSAVRSMRSPMLTVSTYCVSMMSRMALILFLPVLMPRNRGDRE